MGLIQTLRSAGVETPPTHPGGGWKDEVDPPDFNLWQLGLCGLVPQFYAEFSSAHTPPHEYSCTFSLELPHFAAGETLLWGKSPMFSLLAVNNSFPLPSFGLVVSIG